MAKVEIYTSPFCGFCFRAKGLLESKNVAFEEIDVMMDRGRKTEMVTRAGGRSTVPQIFIDDHHVGGCDDLFALDAAGKLDPMLGGAA
jgi:glutaredoxin 3